MTDFTYTQIDEKRFYVTVHGHFENMVFNTKNGQSDLELMVEETINPPEIQESNSSKKKRIIEALDELDLKTIRPLRAGETSRLQQLESEAQALRQELAGL